MAEAILHDDTGQNNPNERYQAADARRVLRRRGFQNLLDNRLTDGGDAVRLTRRPTALYPLRNIPGTHFCKRLTRPEGFGQLENAMAYWEMEAATFRLVA
jgi:hypothetical protein